MLATLGVADNNPVEAEVFDLVSAYFTGVGAVLLGGDVLSSDLHITVQHGFGRSDMEEYGRDNHFNSAWVELDVVEHFSALLADEVDRAIRFPVATDDVLA